jgi:hypothetical protein
VDMLLVSVLAFLLVLRCRGRVRSPRSEGCEGLERRLFVGRSLWGSRVWMRVGVERRFAGILRRGREC